MMIKQGYDIQCRTESRNVGRGLSSKFGKSQYWEKKYGIGGCIEEKHPPLWFTAGDKDMPAGSIHLWENQPEVVHTPP